VTRSRTTAGRARNGLIALLGALLTLAVAGAEAGAATYTFKNPYAWSYATPNAEAYRDSQTKGYHVALHVVGSSDYAEARVGPGVLKSERSGPKARVVIRVKTMTAVNTNAGVWLSVNIDPTTGLGGTWCVQRVIMTGQYVVDCDASQLGPRRLFTVRAGLLVNPPMREITDATATVESITVTK
jgi:hypothetical protein